MNLGLNGLGGRMRRECKRVWCWMAHREYHTVIEPDPSGMQGFPFDFDAKWHCALCDGGGRRVPPMLYRAGLLAA